MFLTENEAQILLYDRSRLTTAEIKKEVKQLKSHSSGQYALMLDTGAKLKFDTHRQAFYLDSYCHSECDIISLYDSLELLKDYFIELEDNREFTSEQANFRKKVYQGYEESRLRQVA